MVKLQDRLTEIFLRAAFEKYPDLHTHTILEAWVEGDNQNSFVIKSKRTDENGTQIFLTRLTVNIS